MIDPNILAVVGAALVTAIGAISVGGYRYIAARETNSIQQLREYRDRVEGLEAKVAALQERESQNEAEANELRGMVEALTADNRRLRKINANLQRKLARLENELEYLKRYTFGDGDETGPIE